MDRDINQLKKALFRLPHAERAGIARELIVSLAKPREVLLEEDWLALWMDEVQRREVQIDSGNAPLLTHDQVIDTLKWSLAR